VTKGNKPNKTVCTFSFVCSSDHSPNVIIFSVVVTLRGHISPPGEVDVISSLKENHLNRSEIDCMKLANKRTPHYSDRVRFQTIVVA
jgi:hypothetical protein